MNFNLKKIIKAILIISIGVMAIDIAVGRILDAMIVKLNDCGETSLTNYVYSTVNTPVIIVGASCANHHYVPKMIWDSIGLKTYNAGRDGQHLLYCSCMLNAIMNRYSPKILIWELAPSDLFEAEMPIALKPYYHQDSLIKLSINHFLGWKSNVLMFSNLYRYNTTASKIISRAMLSSQTDTIKTDGYLPIPAADNNLKLQSRPEKFDKKIDPFLLSQFKFIISKAKRNGTQIIIAISPTLRPYASQQIDLIDSMCKDSDVPLMDNSQLSDIVNNPALFKDYVHLNQIGAEKYTEIFLRQLNTIQ